MKTINQKRSEFALREVENVKKNNSDLKKYKSLVRKLPSLIITNGLLPTIAFLNSKSEYKQVYDSVEKWLTKERKIFAGNNLLQELSVAEVSKLRLATMEVLALADWLKRAVEIMIEDKDE